MPIAPALSAAGRIAPWALTAASYLPDIISGAPGILSGLNRPTPAYRPAGGGMGGRRGTSGQTRSAQVGNLPAGYTQSELAAGAAAEAFREGAGFPGQQRNQTFGSTSAPIERAYQDEKNRIAQLTAQDELVKKYNVADLTKAYNAAKTPEEKEKLGLQIWATTNPQLAQKLKPGQLGYTEATSAFMSQSPLGSLVKSVGDMQFVDKVSFPGEPVAGAFNLQTPISGIELPEAIKQVGVSEKFGDIVSPAVAEAISLGYSDPAQLFKPDLTQTQQALLKQAFAKGLK